MGSPVAFSTTRPLRLCVCARRAGHAKRTAKTIATALLIILGCKGTILSTVEKSPFVGMRDQRKDMKISRSVVHKTVKKFLIIGNLSVSLRSAIVPKWPPKRFNLLINN
jgi:hypothetical protein